MKLNNHFILTKKDGEFLRVIASLSVVIAHCVHFWVDGFYHSHNYLSIAYLATAVDQTTRFTVPLFFFLSGFGLTLQFMKRPMNLVHYYKYRLIKVLAPFLLWSFFCSFRHIELFLTLPWQQDPLGTWKYFFKFLFLDGFDYQYYFLIVIFQFYVFFPLLYRLGKSKIWMGVFFVLHMALLSPIEAYLELFELQLPRIHANIIVYHLFYCYVGIYAAWHKDFLISLSTKWSTQKTVWIWIGIFLLLNFEFLMNMYYGKTLADTDHFNRWSVLLYCLASILLFIKVKDWVSNTIYNHSRFQFLFTHVAPYTFFVYLAHTHVLRGVDYLLWEVSLNDFLNRLILVLVGTYTWAWFTQWLLEDFPKIKFFLGLPEKIKMDWSGLPGFKNFTINRNRIRTLWPQNETPNESSFGKVETK